MTTAAEDRASRSGQTACLAAFDFHQLGQRFRFGKASLQAVAGDCELDDPLLRLVVAQVDERVSAHIVADARIEVAPVELIAERFSAVCNRLEEQAGIPMMLVDFLLPAERRRLLVGINDTDRTFSTEGSVLSLIGEQVQLSPEAPAIEQGNRVLSYQELDARAAALATDLKRRGLGEGDRVGIFLERSIELIVAVVGVLQSGAAYVPLDPSYPRERLQAMSEDAGVAAVVTREGLLNRLPREIAEEIIAPDWESPVSGRREVPRLPPPEPEALAYVIFTSGSTGRPKGVAITHRGLALSNLARIEAYDEPVDRFLLLSSFSFDSSLVGIFWTLCTGGCLVLIDEDLQKDPERVVQVVQEAGITHLLTLPTYWSFVLDSDATTSIKSLKTAIVAGEACPSGVVEKHRRLLPRTRLFSEYGATETSIFATLYRCDEIAFPTVPLGRPVANARLYLLDSELQPVPTGAVGEVYFGGRVISPGYYGRPDLTAERFLPDPFSTEPGARMYRSGDLGRYTESGELIFRGRSDHQVKIRGYRVELEEIESGLLRHPSVRRAAVVAYRPSEVDRRRVAAEDAGLDGLRLAGFFETFDRMEPTREELRKFLMEALPSHMVPGHLVRVARLPTTPTGKVDRSRLLALLPAVSGDDGSSSPTSPEGILLQLWREVLGSEAVGIEDNYFDLGGDSILSLAIVARARESGLRLSPIDIFQFPTIRELVRRVEVVGSVARTEGPVAGSVPLTPIQHWFTELDIPNPNHWNMPLWIEVPWRVGVEELSQALLALADHHDALRLRLTRDGDRWLQEVVVAEPLPIIERFEIEDPFVLSETGERIRRPDFTKEGIDLQSGPLSRCWLLALPGERSVLFWNAHHAALDLVSWGILLRDLESALHQIAAGQAVHLPEKTSSFRAWAEALEKEAASETLQQEREFWLSMLAPPCGLLPVERGDRTSNRERDTAVETAELTVDETSILMRREGARVGDVVLTSLVCVLTQWSDNSAVTIELENHGRSEVLGMDLDLSRTVGWFTASYPVRFRSSRAQEVQAVVETRKRLESVPRNGIGWGLLRYLVRDEDIRALSLPEVLFSYLGHADFAATRQLRILGGDLYYPGTRDPQAARPHLLEVGAWIVDGKLRITWRFSEELYHRSTIVKLIQAQRRWLQHWMTQSGESMQQAPDSPFGWDTAAMSKIVAAIERSRKRD